MREYHPLLLVLLCLILGIWLSAIKMHQSAVAWHQFSVQHHCAIIGHTDSPMNRTYTVYHCDNNFEVIR